MYHSSPEFKEVRLISSSQGFEKTEFYTYVFRIQVYKQKDHMDFMHRHTSREKQECPSSSRAWVSRATNLWTVVFNSFRRWTISPTGKEKAEDLRILFCLRITCINSATYTPLWLNINKMMFSTMLYQHKHRASYGSRVNQHRKEPCCWVQADMHIRNEF